MGNSARVTRRALLSAGAAGALAGALGLTGCSSASTVIPPAQGALVQANGVHDLRDKQQAANLAIIVGESIRRGLPPRAATIAIVTAMQESKLYNLNHGDLDSLGLFQQRPSQGWGTADQIMDPWYSSGRFYQALVKVSGWQDGNINDVAQEVQQSGVPDGYAEHEPVGRAWASALTGQEEAAVTMVDRSNQAAATDQLTDFVQKVWPSTVLADAESAKVNFSTPDTTTSWALAQLLICRGPTAGLISMQVGPMSWTNSGTTRAPWTGTMGSVATSVVAGLRKS
ncbi:hypothetical protein [Propionibacterium sp.]|uniref:hypothetical protein n=1 Tax=Propionibacterium sp. TaxID=1977903 RepID=UPI0039ECC74F